MATQQDIDEKIGSIMSKLAADVIVDNLFDGVGLLLLIDANILSPRQIAKKITSYSINPLTGLPYSDKELNLMYYGQDLESKYTDYKPYFSEKEYMVSYEFGYEPIDIRDQLKDKIHEIVRGTRKDLLNFEIAIKNLIANLPRVATQALTGILAITIPQVSMPPAPLIASNSYSAAQIAYNLHSSALIIRKIIIEALLAVNVFSTNAHLTIGSNFDNSITVPNVRPSINGSIPTKMATSSTVTQIPKINFLLPNEILNFFNEILIEILLLLDLAASTLIAIDSAAFAFEVAAAGPSAPILIGQQAAIKVVADAIKTKIGTIGDKIKDSSFSSFFKGGASSVIPDTNSPESPLKDMANNAKSNVAAAVSANKISPENSVIKAKNNGVDYPAQVKISLIGGQWNSSNESIVFVNGDGILYGQKPGKAIITYTRSDVNFSATASVRVIN